MAIALAGNKTDLEPLRQVKFQEAKSYADEKGLIYMETSAKQGKNVNEIFHNLATKMDIVKKHSYTEIKLNDDQNQQKHRNCCS